MQRTLLLSFLLAGCVGQITSSNDDQGDDQPTTCAATRSYVGFGGTPLESDRPTVAAGTDRMRMKPFASLAAEYSSALGLTSFDTSAFATTFGKPPARWYSEPAASANTIYAAFALAYSACTQHTANDPLYASAPDAQLAGLVCNDHIRKAWHREPMTEETAACVNYAVNQTVPSDSPRVRWAYTCAAVLTASGFLAY